MKAASRFVSGASGVGLSKAPRLTIQDVRMGRGGTYVRAAPLRFFDVRLGIKGRVVRSGADWTAIAEHINRRRDSRNPFPRRQRIGTHEYKSRVFHCRKCGERGVHLVRTRMGGPRPKYCSPACEPPRPSRAKEREEIKCARCGELFTPRRSDARTCSPRCRTALHRSTQSHIGNGPK